MAKNLDAEGSRAVIGRVQLSWPTRGHTCLIKQIVVFFGDKPQFDDIEKFYDTTSTEAIQRASAESGYPMTLYDEEHYEYAVFERTGSKMQPAVWVAFKNSAYRAKFDVAEVELRK